MQKVIEGLEVLAGAVKKSSQPAAVSQAIQNIRKDLNHLKENPENRALFQTLDEELGIWLKKLETILKEPAGREGMVKHSRHWAEKLKKFGDKK
jgi:hypothetical protein